MLERASNWAGIICAIPVVGAGVLYLYNKLTLVQLVLVTVAACLVALAVWLYRRTHPPIHLSNDAVRILALAYHHGRFIARIMVFQKPEHVQAGAAPLYDPNDPTVADRFLVALDELLNLGLIEETRPHLYRFTGPGLKLAMTLPKQDLPPPPEPPEPKVRRQLRAVPSIREHLLQHSEEWHAFDLISDEEKDVPTDGVAIEFINQRQPTPEDVERHKQIGSKRPLAIEPIRYCLMNPVTDDRHPVLKAGSTHYYAAALSFDWPWELVQTDGMFAVVALYSKGRAIKAWDVSEELRPCIPQLLEWRKNGGSKHRTDPQLIHHMLLMHPDSNALPLP